MEGGVVIATVTVFGVSVALAAFGVGLWVGALVAHARREDIPANPGLLVDLVNARRDADMWHDEYHKAANEAKEWREAAKAYRQRAHEQQLLLAALGEQAMQEDT
jgi:ABC-type nitrate/sulfonate/bicarbonate transport system substrate-binding protein